MNAVPVSRREVIRRLALAVTAAGSGAFNLDAARVVHAVAGEARQAAGGYVPRALTLHEYATVTRLAELIVPADAGGGSGVEAGAPEFIDLLCSQNDELAHIYQGGVAWLDAWLRRDGETAFVEASPAEQTRRLDALVDAERRDDVDGGNDGAARDDDALAAGVRFFDWVRRMTVDAYYTSPVGIADLGYEGNRSLDGFEVPAAVQAAIAARIARL